MNLKSYIKLILAIAFTLLIMLGMPPSVLGNQNIPVVKVAMSEDESIIVERILYTALKRSGYQMVAKTAGMRTTVNDVNFGDAAVLPAQTTGLDKEYPNLIKIPVPISYVETIAYTRSEEPHQFFTWSDLAGLRLSHRWQNLYVTRNIPRAKASKTVTLNDYADLWNSLLTGETDVAVIPNLTGFVRIVPKGIKQAGVINREPRYTYVNKNYAELATLLTKTYQEMTDDGTMDKIRNSHQSGNKKTVLHLSSYSSQSEWERGEIAAIRKSLESNPGIEYQNLNMNTNQIPNEASINAITANTIRTNFIERNPDLIIASDNDALDFALHNYYMLFPKTPIVFCGINDFNSSMLHGFEEYVTGVTESISFYKTVNEMLRLYPKTNRIYILNDYTKSGRKWQNSLRDKCAAYGFPVTFEFNENKPLADILKDIQGFDQNTLVLLGSYFLDSGNVFYSEQEVQKLVCAAAKTPVFCLLDSLNGYGTVGGLVSVSDEQGKAAGAMALKILEGTPVSEIPVISDSEPLNRWQFDYAAAKRFNIKTNGLPVGHTDLNRELQVWESNPAEFRIALIAGGFLLVIIIGLAVFLRLMRQKNTHLLEMQSHLHSAEELLQKDNDLRKMIDSLPVPVLIVDIDTRKLEYGNQAFLTANGFDTFEQADQLDLSPLVEEAFRLRQAKSIHFNYGSFRHPNSDICQKITAEKIIYYKKNCLLLISEDITAQLKETEMLTRAAQKEKEANMFKSMFLANMSHEIRTPMNGIIGMTDLLLHESLHRRQLQYVKDIKTSAESLLGIINDILDLSKINEGKLQIMPVDIDLNMPLKNMASMMQFSANSKGLNFVEDIQIKTPEYVRVDDVRLNQVIVNLLSNAVKFTKTGEVKLLAKIEDGNIIFAVSDTGIGIKPEELSLIFKAFEQADQHKNRSIKGTGLGLSISKNLVELMGGKMWVESEYEAGTTFHVTIPYVPGDESAVEKIDYEFKYLSAPTAQVLLVDDIQTNLTVGSGLLRLCGITADVAISGREAIELVKSKDYDIVFMDHMMPEMDGVETVQLIRNIDGKYQELPIIALTANAMNESRDLLLASGMDDFLSKPIDKGALMNILQKWLPAHKVESDTKSAADGQNAPYTEILAAASKLEGLDIGLALSRIGWMQGLLEVSIKQVASSIEGQLKKMDDFLANENLRGFAIEAHGMKGALANIGATRNSELAAELEIASKAENMSLCVNKFTVFADVMENFAHELKLIFPQAEPETQKRGDGDFLALKVGEIIDCLNDFEAADALECLDELAKFTFGEETDAILRNAKDTIEMYDYDKAVSILSEIRFK